jgi:hypothetical protein
MSVFFLGLRLKWLKRSVGLSVCAFALAGRALANDHGLIFSYAASVNSKGEVSSDTGLHFFLIINVFSATAPAWLRPRGG